jgi:hypothetical protein
MTGGVPGSTVEMTPAAKAERQALARLAGPIISGMVTGNCHAARHHTWVVALHEAAHAAVGSRLGLRLEEVSIVPSTGSLGHCRYRTDQPRSSEPVVGSDLSDAVGFAWLGNDCPGWREMLGHMRKLRARARELVLSEWYGIQRLAAALRDKPVLTGEEAEAILDAARRELASHIPAAPGSIALRAQSVDERGVEYASAEVA